eukprot:TRINITY_DN1387_c0_g1_i3.p1 TRINITY_DN1387_c0_g1~~TRINITY_DN1387_c0_g1_i3.p1  ORF type:complete len:104 (-),score=10.80 TRINITY_DN1387_c0_g1_i3:66-377(-)
MDAEQERIPPNDHTENIIKVQQTDTIDENRNIDESQGKSRKERKKEKKRQKRRDEAQKNSEPTEIAGCSSYVNLFRYARPSTFNRLFERSDECSFRLLHLNFT